MFDNIVVGQYDMVNLSGGLCDGHVTSDCFGGFREIIRVSKPGKIWIDRGVVHT